MSNERKNLGKPPLHHCLYGPLSLAGEAAVWQHVADLGKYDEGSWVESDYPLVETLDSLLRHASKLMNGEELDDETGLPHVDHIQCNARILSEHWHRQQEENKHE